MMRLTALVIRHCNYYFFYSFVRGKINFISRSVIYFNYLPEFHHCLPFMHIVFKDYIPVAMNEVTLNLSSGSFFHGNKLSVVE